MFAVLAVALVGCKKTVEVSFVSESLQVAATGETVEVGIKSTGDWTIAATEDWVSITPTSGSGDATLTITVQPNTTLERRTTEVTANTKDRSAVLTLSQDFSNFINVTPATVICDKEGGEFSLEIVSNITWSVSELPSWLALSSTNGTGNAVLTLTIQPLEDLTVESRSHDLEFGDGDHRAYLMVTQNGEQHVTIAVLPDQLQMSCLGETKTVSVVCNGEWTAEVSDAWVSLDVTQQTGDATVAVTVGENPFYVSRSATITFTTSAMTSTVIVNQEATPNPHYLEVAPESITFGPEGGDREIAITCDDEWKIAPDASWLSASEIIGIGDAVVTITAEPNLLTEQRTVVATIVSNEIERTIQVTQEAGFIEPIVLLSPDTLFVPYSGATRSITVTANTTWNLEGSPFVANISPVSGDGDATVSVIIDVNSNEEPRNGYIRARHNGQLMSQTIIVQEGKPDLLEVDITEITAPVAGGTYTIHLTSNQSWSIEGGGDWFTVTPISGFGNKDVVVAIEPLTDNNPREGKIVFVAESGRSVVVRVKQQ